MGGDSVANPINDNGRTVVQPTNRQSVQPPDTRLIEDVRRAIIQQGALYIPGSNAANFYRPVINAAQSIQQERINNDITENIINVERMLQPA